MNDVIKRNISRQLRYYTAKASEYGFTDEELKRVVEETRNDIRRVMTDHARFGDLPVTLTSLLKIRHRQMVERRNPNNNKITNMAKCGLKVAKATEEEFDRVYGFLHPMEALFDGRSFFSNEEDWREWDDDDEDKQLLLKIEKGLKEDWDETADNRLILYEFMKQKFLQANRSGSIGRILFNCSTLIDNCCDPNLDYLEFKPSIMHAERIALEKVEQIITDGEQQGQSPEAIIAAIRQRIEESKKEDE